MHSTFFFTTFRTLWCSEVLARETDGNTARRKHAMEKTQNRAGATRCLCGFCRPNVRTGSLPPKSPIGNRQGPFGTQKQKKLILPETFFRLFAH